MCFFFKSDTLLAISKEWLDWLIWHFEKAFSKKLLAWLVCNTKEANQSNTGPTVWLFPLTTPMNLTLTLQGQNWNRFILGMVGSIDMEQKRCELIIHDHDSDLFVWPWWGGWIYLIENGVTSVVGVPLTHLILHFTLLLVLSIYELNINIEYICSFENKQSKNKLGRRYSTVLAIYRAIHYLIFRELCM